MQKSEPKPNNTRFKIRPASPEEAGLFYAQLPAEDQRLGAIGHYPSKIIIREEYYEPLCIKGVCKIFSNNKCVF